MLFLACSSPAEEKLEVHESQQLEETASGILMLAGGGSEGEKGDSNAWSARLYGELLKGGDITGDGKVRVAVLSTGEESSWMLEYFVWLGALQGLTVEAFNLKVSRRSEAKEVDFSKVDVAFIKGGDQGEYYDLWNDTELEKQLRSVWHSGGGIGGTSAGAMSQAGYALAGGWSLISLEVLVNGRTPYLGDTDGGSGIHNDFLGFLPDTVVDTHFTQRGRLGRLVGAMAETVREYQPLTLRGIGLEEQTGILVEAGVATVVGVGSVTVIEAEGSPVLEEEKPLQWGNLLLHRLVDGWSLVLESGEVRPGPAAEVLSLEPGSVGVAGAWEAAGDQVRQEERFEQVIERAPEGFGMHAGTELPVLGGAMAVLDAFDSSGRGSNEESLFRALYEQPGMSGLLVASGSSLVVSEGTLLAVIDNPASSDAYAAAIVIGSQEASARELAPLPSLSDIGDGSLHAAGLAGLRLSVVASEGESGGYFDLKEQRAVP